MRIDEFKYELPEELIAKYPVKERDRCRLLYLNRKNREMKDLIFKDIVKILKKGDLIVLNRTKVIPARVFGRKMTGGKVEILFIREVENNLWLSMVKGRNLKNGMPVESHGVILTLEKRGNNWYISFPEDIKPMEFIKRYGLPPLPPYIKREITKEDYENYQTVFAEENGSIAAPTAGLHFTEELIEELKNNHVEIGYITLHVGPGTFKPVRVENVEDHIMDEEDYHIGEDIIEKIENAERTIAVGTTVVRALEDNFSKNGRLVPGKRKATLFIYPGYKFKVIDGFITNFHLPESTPLLLTAAFAGKELLFEAYRHAIREKYRFLSYGDAMIIL